MNCVTNEYLHHQNSYLGQVMNKVQKQRKISRQGSNQALTKNKAKLQAAAKAAHLDGSLNNQTVSRFQSLKFTVKTLHFLITTMFLMIPVWLFCLLCRLFNYGDWSEVYSEYSVAIIGSRSPLAIHLARHFRRMGYTVIGLESRRYMCAPLAWSRACDKFYWLPDPLDPPTGAGSDVYVEALWGILLDLKPNMLIPLNRFTSSEDQQVIDKMKEITDLLSMEPIEVLKLTDVHTFYTQASDCNCKTPLHTLIADKAKIEIKGFNFEDHPFVYRIYSQNMWGAKLVDTPKTPRDVSTLVQHITTQNPVLRVERFSEPVVNLCSLYANRKAIAHAVSKRENDLISTVSDRSIVQCVTEWSEIFVERYHLDIEGWLSFDFMKSSEDGLWYPINCKPWVTEPFALLHNVSSYLIEGIELTTRGREEVEAVTSGPDCHVKCSGQDLITAFRKPYRLVPDLFRLLSRITHTDILFMRSDPFPFFATYFVDLPMQLWLYWRTGRLWEKIDYFNNTIR
ncbi:hypothetical protein ACHWQZ_G015928 [Mnemiopsis leidyi]